MPVSTCERSAVSERPAVPETHAVSESVLVRAGRLEVRVAGTQADIERAMTLRYRVFSLEMGARLETDAGLDVDGLDAWCAHLIAVDRDAGNVVGTYRVLLPEQARLAGCYYAEREFDLRNLDPIRHDLVELGRACIEPGYRNGVVLMLLWRAMREYVAGFDHQHVIGCCSVPFTADDGVTSARLYRQLAPIHLADARWRVFPRRPLDLGRDDAPASAVEVPALLKGYLKAGARMLGAPHVDARFGCADFPIMLEVRSLNPRLDERLRQA